MQLQMTFLIFKNKLRLYLFIDIEKRRVFSMIEEFKYTLHLKNVDTADLNLLILPPVNWMARVTPNDYH